VSVEEPNGVCNPKPPSGSEEALLARLGTFETYGVGLPEEIDIRDLAPQRMESWTEEQFARAGAADVFQRLEERDWPPAARDGAADGTDGMCKVRQLYRLFHPPGPPPPQARDDFAGCDAWEDEIHGWLTNFPPPAGFAGYESGEPGTDDYERELDPEEAAIVAGDEARQHAEEEAERVAMVAEQEAARRRYFELDEPDEPPAGPPVIASGSEAIQDEP